MEYHGKLYGKIGRKSIPLTLTSADVDGMVDRLKIIAADAASISDEWLAKQPEGIRTVIANIRRHAKTE